MWLRREIRQHYSKEHPGEPLHFEVMGKKKASNHPGSSNEKKVARIQG